MAGATWLPEILRLPRTRKLAFILAVILAAGAVLGAVYFAVDGQASARLVRDYGVAPLLPLAVAGGVSFLAPPLVGVGDGRVPSRGAPPAHSFKAALLVCSRVRDTRAGWGCRLPTEWDTPGPRPPRSPGPRRC